MLALACWAVAATSSDGSSPASRPPLAVQVETATAAEGYSIERHFAGRVRAQRRVLSAFERGGRLDRVAVQEGDRVEIGALLAELDTEPVRRRLVELQGSRDAAQARLDEAVAGPRRERIEAARRRVEELVVQWDLAVLRTQRREELVAAGVLSVEELDAFATADQALKARREAAEAELEELETGTRTEQIDALRADLAQWQARVSQLQLDLDRSELRAPFAGSVVQRLRDEGTVLEAGAAVLELVEDRALEAWVGVPEERTRDLRPGQSATLHGASGPLSATLRAVLPDVDAATRTRTVVLDLDAPERATPGETVELILEQRIDYPGVWIPLRSLSRGERGVFLCSTVVGDPDSSIVELHEVEVLHRDGDLALVRGSVEDGDRLLIGGTLRVAPGQSVRVVEP